MAFLASRNHAKTEDPARQLSESAREPVISAIIRIVRNSTLDSSKDGNLVADQAVPFLAGKEKSRFPSGVTFRGA